MLRVIPSTIPQKSVRGIGEANTATAIPWITLGSRQERPGIR